MDHVLKQATAGNDAFKTEEYVHALAARLESLTAWLGHSPPRIHQAFHVLASNFQGARLVSTRPVRATRDAKRGLRILPGRPTDNLILGREAFLEEFVKFLSDYEQILVAEFHIVSLALEEKSTPTISTTIEFEFVGRGKEVWRLQKNGHWKMVWKKGDQGYWQVLRWMNLGHTQSESVRPVFVDASLSAFGHAPSYVSQLRYGVDHWLGVVDEALGLDVAGNNGIAAGDIDGDGLDDFYISQPSGLPNRLYHNQGDGTFEDITEAAGVGVLDPTSMSLFSDIDNDGDQDLIVITWQQPLLFLNDGQGHFTFREHAFKFEGPPRGSFTGASLADFDRDGDLDLYICTYMYFKDEGRYQLPEPYHDANNGPPNLLLRNDGKGHFVEVTGITGTNQNNHRFSFACAWADYDQDGWPDLYVANDFGRNNLYRNNGRTGNQVTFTDVAEEAGVEDVGAGMSVSWFDYDNDGYLDLYVGNMWSAAGQRLTQQETFHPAADSRTLQLYQRHAKGNTLLRNRGDGTFEDVSLREQVAKGRWAWSCDPLDFDNDGWQDLYITNGYVTGEYSEGSRSTDLGSFFWRQVAAQSPLTTGPSRRYDDGWRALNRLLRDGASLSGHERDILLRNSGTGNFHDVSGAVGLDIDHDGRSFAVADYDLDGDADILLKSRGAPQTVFLRNDLETDSASVSFRLVGVKSNRDAVGAVVSIETESTRQIKMVQAGSGFLSQHSKELLFGLGNARDVGQVTIQWPSGLRQVLSKVPLNHRVQVEEGNQNLQVQPFRNPNYSASPAPEIPDNSLDFSLQSGIWLSEPYLAPGFRLKDLEGDQHRLSDYRDGPLLIHFWATWCPPCIDELKAFQSHLDRLKASAATLLAVNVNDAEEVSVVEKFLHKEPLDFTILMGDPAMLRTYSVLNKYLFGKNQDLRIPTTFLLDAKGRIVKLYRGPTQNSEVLSDLKQLGARALPPLRRALPFPGKFYSSPPGRNYFQLGISFSEEGLMEPALIAFQEALKKSPKFAKAHYNLGTSYMRTGDEASARSAFVGALKLKPGYPEAHNNLGTLLAGRGHLWEAVAHFKTALDLQPDYPLALNNLGHAYMELGKIEEASEALEEAVKLQPDFPEAWNNLGIICGNQRNLKKAKVYFEKAVQARSDYPEAALNLAMVSTAMGLHEEAVRLLHESLQQSPAFEPSYLFLAQIYLQTGQVEEGIHTIQKLLKRNPNHSEAKRLLHSIGVGANEKRTRRKNLH